MEHWNMGWASTLNHARQLLDIIKMQSLSEINNNNTQTNSI